MTGGRSFVADVSKLTFVKLFLGRNININFPSLPLLPPPLFTYVIEKVDMR